LLVFESRVSIARVATHLPLPFRNSLEDRLQDSLFGSTEDAEINGRC